MLVGTDVCVPMVFVWEESGVPEETHLSDLVTAWPFHMPMPGIEPGSQLWEASALPLRQPDRRLLSNGCQTMITFETKACDLWFLQ